MLSPICPECRSPVEIPADHFEATIRCGICWAEVIVERPAIVAVEAIVDEPVVLEATEPGPNLLTSHPGYAVKGMEPLEALLAGVAVKLPHLLLATDTIVEPMVEVVEAAAPRAPAKRREEDGLRRKRGVISSSPDRAAPPPAPEISFTKLLLIALVAIAVFVAGYFLMR